MYTVHKWNGCKLWDHLSTFKYLNCRSVWFLFFILFVSVAYSEIMALILCDRFVREEEPREEDAGLALAEWPCSLLFVSLNTALKKQEMIFYIPDDLKDQCRLQWLHLQQHKLGRNSVVAQFCYFFFFFFGRNISFLSSQIKSQLCIDSCELWRCTCIDLQQNTVLCVYWCCQVYEQKSFLKFLKFCHYPFVKEITQEACTYK